MDAIFSLFARALIRNPVPPPPVREIVQFPLRALGVLRGDSFWVEVRWGANKVYSDVYVCTDEREKETSDHLLTFLLSLFPPFAPVPIFFS